MEEQGLLDPKQGFPQTNAQDLMGYREVFDLDYAMSIQREGGITLSLMTNGGEVAWLAHDLLKVSTVDGIKYLNDEYVDIMNRFPGEFCRASIRVASATIRMANSLKGPFPRHLARI